MQVLFIKLAITYLPMRKLYSFVYYLVLITSLPLSSQSLTQAEDVSFNPDDFRQITSGQLFVRVQDHLFIDISYDSLKGFNNRIAEHQFDSLIDAYGISKIERTFKHLKNNKTNSIFTVYFSRTDLSEQLIHSFNTHPFIDYAEPIPVYHTLIIPNDTFFYPQQYYLHIINADTTWSLVQGSASVRIAIVDDAIMITHEDLANNIWHNPNEIAGDSIDNDSNGYIDDYMGYDVADADADVMPPSPQTHKHGTQVAGVASAESNNHKGVASVGFNCRLIPIKTKHDYTIGNTLDEPWLGVEYAISMKAEIINMSWGSSLYNQTFDLLCQAAHDSGIVMVASAGNSGSNMLMYPASYTDVISVAACDMADFITIFSTVGDSVDIVAPGIGIYTTQNSSVTNGYSYFSGTSASAPIISGTIGLMLSNNPSMTPDMVEYCLENGARNIYYENPNYIGEIGSGRVDVLGAVTCIEAPEPLVTCHGNFRIFTCRNEAVTIPGDYLMPNAASYHWYMPGAVPYESYQQNPVVSYPYQGLYDLILVYCDYSGNCDSIIWHSIVYVYGFDAFVVPSGNQYACLNETAYFTVSFPHADPPISICYTDGLTIDTITGITNTDISIPVFLDGTKTLSVIWIRDDFCFGNVIGNLTLIPTPCEECTNMDFSLSNFVTWDGWLGHCCGNQNHIEALASDRQKILSTTGFDPHSLGNVPMTDTADGGFESVRLGNWFVGKESEALFKRIKINYDNALLCLRYAVVLEDPLSHSPNMKPKFSARILDTLGNVLPGSCSSYEVTAGPQTAGWQAFNLVRYKDWESLTIDLAQYIGQEVVVEFVTEDCGLGGHFGYAYIDAQCHPLTMDVINYCDSTTYITMIAPAGFESYLWSPSGDTTQSIQISNWSSGDTIMVTAVNAMGCTSTLMHILQSIPSPNPILSLSDTIICQQDTITITATGAGIGGVYHWTSSLAGLNVTADSIVVFPDSTTTYFVQAENIYGCLSDSIAMVTIALDNHLIFELPADTLICHGDEISIIGTLFPQTNQAYLWTSYPPFYTDTNIVIQVTPQYPTMLYFTITETGCNYTDGIFIDFAPLSSDDLITHAYLCEDDTSIVLNAPAGTNFYWIETGDTIQSILINHPPLYSIYNVVFSNAYGCADTARFIIDYMGPAEADAGPDTSTCPGMAVTLIGSGSYSPSATYHWYSIPAGFSADSATIVVSPLVNTMYILEVTNGDICPGNPSYDTVYITIVQGPEFDLGPDIEICLGDVVQLYQDDSHGFHSWYSDPAGFYSEDSIAIVSPVESTVYHLTIFSEFCAFTDSIRVLIADTPSTLADTAMANACFINDSIAIITAPDTYDNYYWLQFDSIGNQITVTNPYPGQIFTALVQVPGELCYDTLLIAWMDLTLEGSAVIEWQPDTAFCEGALLYLNVADPDSTLQYDWFSMSDSSHVLLSNSNSFAFEPTPIDSSILLQAFNGSCYAWDTLLIDVSQLPSIFELKDTTLCYGDTLHLIIADSIYSAILWSDGDTASHKNISSSGLYSVSVTNGSCQWTGEIEVTILPEVLDVIIPNVITPNGDGYNDALCVEALLPAEYHINIYDRWGLSVYESEDPYACWDGTIANHESSDGTYFYLAIYRSVCQDAIIEKQGTLTIIR